MVYYFLDQVQKREGWNISPVKTGLTELWFFSLEKGLFQEDL